MSNAAEIIRDMLKDVGIDHKFDEEENKVSFKINNSCEVEVHKHAYVAGYGIRTRCILGENKKIDSSASFINRLMVTKDKDRFYLYGMSNDAALNAGIIETKIPAKKEPKESGQFYIKCEEGFGYECKVEKSKL